MNYSDLPNFDIDWEARIREAVYSPGNFSGSDGSTPDFIFPGDGYFGSSIVDNLSNPTITNVSQSNNTMLIVVGLAMAGAAIYFSRR